VSRETRPTDALVITFGRFHAGTAVNIIPDTAQLDGTIRSLSPALLQTAPARFKALVEGIAAAHGARAGVALVPGYPVTVNDADASHYVARVAHKLSRARQVVPDYEPVLASEDFAFYQLARPGAFYFLGSRPADRPTVPSLHHPKFDYNDDLLPLAIEMHSELARHFAAGWRQP
ncbi:MAG: M20 metallopeptidase family protein, partial [Opitutaceae bacterium]